MKLIAWGLLLGLCVCAGAGCAYLHAPGGGMAAGGTEKALSYSGEKGAEETAERTPSKPTEEHGRGRLELQGTVINPRGEEARAIIFNPETRKTNYYATGDMIPDAGGAKVVEISRDSVVIKRKDKRETLQLTEAEEKKQAGPRTHRSRERSAPPSADEIVSLNFDHVDIKYVIELISDLTGKNFILSDQVRGNVTVMSPTKIPVKNLLAVLDSILEVRGLAMVPAGDMILVVSKRDAVRRAIGIETGKETAGPVPGSALRTRFIHLRYADLNEVQRVAQTLAGRDASIIPYPPTHSLIITDTAPNIDRLAGIIKELDVPGMSVDVRALIKQFSEQTGKNVAVGEAIRGNVMVLIPTEISKGEQLKALEAILGTYGIVMTAEGEIIRIMTGPNFTPLPTTPPPHKRQSHKKPSESMRRRKSGEESARVEKKDKPPASEGEVP